ncbi:putative dehydrogenase [Halanaerobium saccharolyticum]|uniref:Putative dehydrogenase n=1 Tax=Halanaerobium saccharolyticum TaxID=43595 RepID=A0A4R7Z7A5_9FIRM|nr:Gfo/Idh/MocA family oxidoreductase [Halanaerobium saccharolyticum]RAK12674.1 putative dehydrogenase [Halanaerobium saccharolyticum]TDW05414.1 putative dehydrogenase [Halanaerobium saccharolyticum]TDX62929.1 putative dehydrogenase [Halanaerobium saccharolyticum]
MNINYSLSGLGGIAKTHLMGLKNLAMLELGLDFKINLSTLATSHPQEKGELAREIGFDRVVDDFDKLLKADVDLVDLCTPNFLHAEETLKALAADKHIYCEKPLALNLEEAETIMEQLEGKDFKNQIAFVYRFAPAVAYAHALLKNKIIGEVQFAKIEYYHSRYLNPEVPISWRLKKDSSGGGALVDLGSHMIDLSRFLLGEVESLSAWTKTFVNSRKTAAGKSKKVDVDDWAMLMLDFASGARGTLEASRVSPGNEGFRFHIFGDQGAIYIDSDQEDKVQLFDQTPEEIRVTEEMVAGDQFLDRLLELYPGSKSTQGMMIDLHLVSLIFFFESIAKGKANPGVPTFEDGYETQKIIEAAYQSAEADAKNIEIK